MTTVEFRVGRLIISHTLTWIKLRQCTNLDDLFDNPCYQNKLLDIIVSLAQHLLVASSPGRLYTIVHATRNNVFILFLYSLSRRTSYPKISRSREAARFEFELSQSLWHMTGTSPAARPRCLANRRAIRSLPHPISRLRDFQRFGSNTSNGLVNKGPELFVIQWCNKAQIISIIKMYLTSPYIIEESSW